MSNKTTIQSHNTRLNNLLEDINNLPETGGVELPTLINEGAAADILLGKQLINQEGEIVEGTMPNNGEITTTFDGINSKSFTIPSGYTSGGTVSLDNRIDNEVDAQTDLIAQIATAVDELPETGNGGATIETVTGTVGALPFGVEGTLYYVDGNGSLQEKASTGTISVMKNSIIVADMNGTECSISGGGSNISNVAPDLYTFYITDDFVIMI